MKKVNPDLAVALTSAGILTAAFATSVQSGSVVLANIPLPTVCAFKLLTSLDCPGCGLTRALVLAAHAHFTESYFMHIWGIPLLFLLLFQIPYRLVRYRNPRWQPPSVPVAVKKWISPAVFLSFLLPWAVKTTAILMIRYL
jgi:hypothetical protein